MRPASAARALAAVAALGLAPACGESAVCGNGVVEAGEQCDDGNLSDDDACSSICRAQSTIDTFIRFLPFLATEYPGFFESCAGLDIETVELTVTGPRTFTEMVPCSFGQLKVASLPPGSYSVKAVALDRAGAPLSRGLAEKSFVVAGVTQEVQIDWTYADFTGDYTGTFYFRVFWGDADTCVGASPPVVRQRLLMTRLGVVVPGMTDSGLVLDGLASGDCRDARTTVAQAANGLAWGPARFMVFGEDADGTDVYRGSFDTFVGAGISNPVLDFHAESLAPDAGVEPDAL